MTSTAGTELSGSLSNVTCAVREKTFVTRPINPSAVTTGVLRRMPLLLPAAIVTCCANGVPGNEMTVVFTAR